MRIIVVEVKEVQQKLLSPTENTAPERLISYYITLHHQVPQLRNWCPAAN